MRRKILLAAVMTLLITVATTAIVYAHNYANDLADQKVRFTHNQTELKKVNQELDKAKKDTSTSQDQVKKLEQEKQDLQTQLQAKIEQKNRIAAAVRTVAQAITPVASADSGCGDNEYAAYIYSHESSCSSKVTNPEGCVGIGQACPASKLIAVCPALDYECENQFFTGYAMNVYGSWEAAYNHWLIYRSW